MTIVREIEHNIVNGVLQIDKFKIVYVAPMKALAAEMTENFGKRLGPLGVAVRELTGDMQLTKTEIKNTQVRCSRVGVCVCGCVCVFVCLCVCCLFQRALVR